MALTKSEQTRIAAIAALVEARHEENVRRLDAIDAAIKQVGESVSSLMTSRAYGRGMVKAAGIVGGIVATVVSVVIAYLKGSH